MADGFSSPRDIFELPSLVVFGAGNSLAGPQRGTLINAGAAVSYLDSYQASGDIMFALGRGPNPSLNYPETEAEVIARVIKGKFGAAAPSIQCDTRSGETVGNIVELAAMLEAFPGVGHLGFVAAKAHAERAKTIAAKVLGKRYDIRVMPSEASPVFGTAKERALSGLYRAVTVGVDPGNLSLLERRHNAYRRVVTGPKRLVRAFPGASSRY